MLVISNLSYALPNGDALFSNLSFSCSQSDRISAVIGRNGIGKSTLLQCIANQMSGVNICGTIQTYQQISVDEVHDLRVIDALGLGQYFDALKRVENGTLFNTDIDLLEHHWDVIERAEQWLKAANLPLELTQPLQQLSGGQRAKTRLVGLLKQAPDVLLLDEPTNHLDQASTQWLIGELKKTNSTVLLVSHDRQLLRSVQRFLVLDEHGITPYNTNFESLRSLLIKQHEDRQNAIIDAKYRLKKERQAQQAREQKAEQRQRKGEAKRQAGSQSKLLLDRKKDKAQVHNGAQKRLAEQRHQSLTANLHQHQSQRTNVCHLKLSLSSQPKGKHRVLDIIEGILPYGDRTPITLSLDRGERLRLEGPNGSGKSTLIQCIQGELQLSSGHLIRHGKTLYLDQHLSILDQFSSTFELFQRFLPELDPSTVRTFLATIGLRGDRVFLPCCQLSGGERMKAAVLLISLLSSEALLILDETDNHLDLDSQDQLAAILEGYQGALIFASHQEKWIRTDKVIRLSTS